MENYVRLKELVERIETQLEQCVTIHISNGLVGYKGFLNNNPHNVEILLSLEDNTTYDELVGSLLRCVVKLQDGVPEYREPSSKPVDTKLARRAAVLREELGA